MNTLKAKGCLLFIVGKAQTLTGKFTHNDIYIIRGRYKTGRGKILITQSALCKLT